jgi:ketosteroid isomerase-like protein
MLPRSLLAPVLGVALALTACGARRIPGTDIPDNSDTRAIVAVIDQYRKAVEARNAEAVLALVSSRYFDDAGTPDPVDDLDREQLGRVLPRNLEQLTAVRLGIGVNAVDVSGDTATANVFYEGHYRVATASGEAAKQSNDVAQMRFVREGSRWLIVSGL